MNEVMEKSKSGTIKSACHPQNCSKGIAHMYVYKIDKQGD